MYVNSYLTNHIFRAVFEVNCALKRWMMIIALSIACFLQAEAQGTSKRVTGRVADAENTPIPGVSIKIKNTSVGTVTDSKGSFSITANEGDVLQITFLGFSAKELTVGSSSSLGTVVLNENVTTLKEVEIVSVGYGSMKKTDLTSAQVSISASDIQKTVNTTIEQAIQGRAANVYVSSSSGQPGAPSSIIIRGINSISLSSQPLYVIDGIQIQFEANPALSNNINPLQGINPDDIETINVLQGPSATSIYGSAGANGVVLITTKRGKAGATKVTANSNVSVQDIPNLIPVMNLREWAEYRNVYAEAGAFAKDPMLADPSVLGEGTNWQDELFRKTLMYKNTLSLSGGNEKTRFYFSGEHLDQQGIAMGSGFKRYQVSLNLDNQTRSWLKLGTSLSVNQRNENVGTSNTDILRISVIQNPSIPVRNSNGSWGGPVTAQFQEINPVALASITDYRRKATEMRGNASVDVTLLKKLVLKNQLNGTMTYGNTYNFKPTYEFGAIQNLIAESSRGSETQYSYNFLTQLNYDLKFKKHSLTSMIAHEVREWGGESLSGKRTNFITNTNQELVGGDALTATNSSGKNKSSRESYFGRLNYVFNNKYIGQFTYRADGASNFGANNRWGYFPSGSVAWRISQESFMKPIAIINDLKLRLEYGLSGNSGGRGANAFLQTVPTGNGTGFLAENFANANLKWETTTTANLGFDLHMYKNRLEVIADVYVKNINDLLTINQYPYYSGGDVAYSAGYIQFPTTNVGDMKNKGLGITINTVNIDAKQLKWKTGLNLSLDRNEITNLYSTAGISTIINNSTLNTLSKIDQTVGLFNGYIYEGLFQNIDEIKNHALPKSVLDANGKPVINSKTGVWVGDVKYKDLNSDGVIDEKDKTIIGNPWPKFTGGFNNAVSYKGFDLNVFFIAVIGNKAFNYTRFESEKPGGSGPNSNYFKSVFNYARPSSLDPASTDAYLTNPGYDIPRMSTNDVNGNNRATQLYVEDASYIRLKNASLIYNFSKKLLARTPFLSGVRAGVNVQNVFTITRYKGYDPEVGMGGIDRARYPSSRMYTFNLTADF